jgi:hypothetical protein
MNAEVLIPISVFAMVLGIVYLVVRKKERMALIEKGLTADVLDSHRRAPSSLKWGMVLLGVGIGILLGRILAEYTMLGEEESFFSMVFLFGGLSLLVYYFVERNMEKKGQNP